MSRQLQSAEEIIEAIAKALEEAEGEFIAEIANNVLPGRVEYMEDSLFEVFWDEDDEEEEEYSL